MRFVITVRHKDDEESWDEDFDKPHVQSLEEAHVWAAQTVQRFNDSLRYKEKARVLLDVKLDIQPESEVHDFEKVNIVTILDSRLGTFDILRCKFCGVTGKRFGLTNFKIDRKFRARKWQKCSRKLSKHEAS